MVNAIEGDAPVVTGGTGGGVDILFLGDTSFGENYQVKLEQTGKVNILKERGYDYSLENFRGMLDGASLAIANFEATLCDGERSPFEGKKKFLHWSDKVRAPRHLRNHNIGVVGLANNHAIDYGSEGLCQTVELLELSGIPTFGAGAEAGRAAQPFTAEIAVAGRNFHLAMIGALEMRRTYRDDYQAYAGVAAPGVNALSPGLISAQIARLKREAPDRFVVAFPHWGNNYAWRTDRQAKLAAELIAAGADMIIGHGAHMLQEMEMLDGRLVAYGIGNFVFNSPGRYAKHGAPPFSLIARLLIDGSADGLRLELRFYPIVSDNRLTNYQPRFVDEGEFADVLRMLSERSRDAGAFARDFTPGRDGYGRFIGAATARA